MKILLIEDDPVWRTEIVIQLESLQFKHVHVITSLEEAVLYLNHNEVDLVISDVILADLSIFNLFEISPRFRDIPFIFITVTEKMEYYVLSKQVENSLYLIKPFHPLSLQSAIDNVFNRNTQQGVTQGKGIKVRGKYGETLILESEHIVFIKSELAYCKIKTPNNQFVVKNNMKNLCSELGPDILQIHRTYAVNMTAILKVDLKFKVVHTAFGTLPIGRKYKPSLVQYLSTTQTLL